MLRHFSVIIFRTERRRVWNVIKEEIENENSKLQGTLTSEAYRQIKFLLVFCEAELAV